MLKNKTGITLIALIITIIVLLILAGVAISLVVGDNGILSRSKSSKEATVVGGEKETIAVSWGALITNKLVNDEEITDERFEQELINNVNDVTVSYDDDGNYLIHFNDTGHNYVVDSVIGEVVENGTEPSEIDLPDIYVTLYTDGTLGFCSTEDKIAGKTVSEEYEYINNNNYSIQVTGENVSMLNLSWYDNIRTNIPWYDQRTSIRVVDFTDRITPGSTKLWFLGCINLEEIQHIQNLDTSNVVSMSHMFNRCEKIEHIDVTGFNTSKCTDMSFMFFNCRKLQELDVSSFNTRKVIYMNAFLASNNMGNWTDGLMSISTIDGLQNFDTRNVINMGCMFSGCANVENINIQNFNTSKCINMNSMFSRCESWSNCDVSGFNTSNCTDFNGMFDACFEIYNLDLSNFDTRKVTNMAYMFNSCKGLRNLNISTFDTSKVTNMDHMFNWCDVIEEIDISAFDTQNVTNMKEMFNHCTNLTTVFVGNGWNTDNVTVSTEMFLNTPHIIGGAGTTYHSNKVDKTYARVDGGTSSPGYFTYKSN